MAYRGKALRSLRESKHLSLRRMASETRIAPRFFEAIEEESFSTFPGKFYFRSFVREYARLLDTDVEQICADMESAYNEWSGETTPNPASLAQTPSPFGLWQRVTAYVRRAQEV